MIFHFTNAKVVSMAKGDAKMVRAVDKLLELINKDELTINFPNISPSDFDPSKNQVLIEMDKKQISISDSDQSEIVYAVLGRISQVQSRAAEKGNLDEVKYLQNVIQKVAQGEIKVLTEG